MEDYIYIFNTDTNCEVETIIATPENIEYADDLIEENRHCDWTYVLR